MKNGNPRESVVADCHGLDLVPVFQNGDERDYAVFRKVSVVELLFGLEEDLLGLYLDELAAVDQRRELSRGKQPENLVARRAIRPMDSSRHACVWIGCGGDRRRHLGPVMRPRWDAYVLLIREPVKQRAAPEYDRMFSK